MWLSSLATTTPGHKQHIELRHKLMGVLVLTVPRTPDALMDSYWRKVQQTISGGDVFSRRSHEAESVPPLVPSDPRHHRLVRRVIEVE